MPRFRRANEMRVLNPKQLPQFDENLLIAIHQLRRRDAGLLRRPLDIHSVLVGTGEIATS